MTAPERTLAQRLAGLERANEIRTYRARLKKEIKAGRRSIDSLLIHPPDEILTAKLGELLLAVPKYGRVKVNKILTKCRVSPSKTIGGMSERQRNEIVRHIRQIESEYRDRQQMLHRHDLYARRSVAA